MSNERDAGGRSGRWVRRDRRRESDRARVQKHGATLRRVYIDAVQKRVKQRKGGA